MFPEKLDRRKTYYKVTNEEECHNGLQYHDGLIIDPVPFDDNPKHTCVSGGIYFTTKEYIHIFLRYGCWIRPIKIPKDARVVLDPRDDKYRADRVVMLPRKDFGWYFDNLFNKKTFPKDAYHYLAEYCSEHFDKWFDNEIFPRKYYYYLAEYCSEHFDKWFDKETFPEDDYRFLIEYCAGYKHIWGEK